MDTYRIARVDVFEEPLFTQLCDAVFPRASAASERFDALAKDELAGRTRLKEQHAHVMVRIGAFEGDSLIGWNVGWFEREGAFYMANSAVLPEHRRKGLYSTLVRGALEEAAAGGAITVRSRHVAANNPVLIAKLKLGFVITGAEFTEEYGFLVRMTYFLREERRQLFLARSLPFAMSREAGGEW